MDPYHEPGEVPRARHAEGADEEVDAGGDEDDHRGDVVQVVQTLLQGGAVQAVGT